MSCKRRFSGGGPRRAGGAALPGDPRQWRGRGADLETEVRPQPRSQRGLVERPQDWPGFHSVRALTEGEPIEGYWFSRTLEYAARQRGETFDRLQYATRETVTLSPLPCWKDLSADARRTRALSLISQIETEAAARRSRTGSEPLGVAAILGRHPHHRPRNLKKSPAPLFHAVSHAVRRELYEGYAWFVAAFRQAAEMLRQAIAARSSRPEASHQPSHS